MKKFLESLIFMSRWTLAPMYLGLAWGMVLYLFKFFEELIHLTKGLFSASESEVMLSLLNLVDITMVGNLILMIMVGGWHIFVHMMEFNESNRPGWLRQINSSTLKIKMNMSLIGVSSIALLRMFVNVDKMPNWTPLLMMLSIHAIFILSTLALGLVDEMLHPKGKETHEEN